MTPEEEALELKRQKRREFSYAYFLKHRSKHLRGYGTNQGGKYAPTTYGIVVTSTDGEQFIIGPYPKFNTAFLKKMKLVAKLIKQGRAREGDVRAYHLFKDGEYNDMGQTITRELDWASKPDGDINTPVSQ